MNLLAEMRPDTVETLVMKEPVARNLLAVVEDPDCPWPLMYDVELPASYVPVSAHMSAPAFEELVLDAVAEKRADELDLSAEGKDALRATLALFFVLPGDVAVVYDARD